jgi:hypothetical protein
VPLSEIAHMGTFNSNRAEGPKIECSKNLKELFEEYKLYKLLRKKDEMSSN